MNDLTTFFSPERTTSVPEIISKEKNKNYFQINFATEKFIDNYEYLNIYNHMLCENFLQRMIDVETINIISIAKKIQHVKCIHPYPVYHTTKSGWFTVVDDIASPNGKRKFRRCSEESLWNALVNWYIDKDKIISLRDIFPKWLQWKETPANYDNIKRIKAAWKAYYQEEPISKTIIAKPIAQITSLELREWAEALLKKHYPVDKKKFYRIFSIVNQCFEYATDEDIHILECNTWQRAKKKINKCLIVSNPVPADEEQVFTDTERKLIKDMVEKDLIRYTKHPTSAGLQILFLFETGLRIGECCGLKWTDIRHNRLYIRRQANNEMVKEWTKSNAGYRDIPLTTEANKILDKVKSYNEEHGLEAEWIFQSSNPDYGYRLSYNAADRKLRKLCARLDIITKSPHKCRKTCISTLLDCPDINNRTVQRFAGHKDISTTFTFYSFERRTKEEQALAIDKALQL
ncbi:MAG: site-specific integrase [Lachnospiraceae bacterium]|nr:site-specific integrase [Lachnospiraceae bacterium]